MNETMLSEIQCVTEMCMVRGVEYSASCRVELKVSEKKRKKIEQRSRIVWKTRSVVLRSKWVRPTQMNCRR